MLRTKEQASSRGATPNCGPHLGERRSGIRFCAPGTTRANIRGLEPYLPSEAAGGGPPAERSEERVVEGARLAEFDLSAAERVHGRLMAAEEASEIAELGRTYQRIARSLRQTLALKARLKRERQAAAKDAPPAKPGGVAVARRIRDLRAAVTRVIWNEAEDADHATELEEEMEDLLTREMLGDDFYAEPLDDRVARACLALGLSVEGAEGWRDLPDPPQDDPAEAPDRRSSA
jgi:hypothetical protein